MTVFRISTFTGADKWYQDVANQLNAQLLTGHKPKGLTGTIICPGVFAQSMKQHNPKAKIIGAVHRDLQPDFRGMDKVIFCAEHLQHKYKHHIPSMVYRPMVTGLIERTERSRIGSIIGAVNLSNNKGGPEVYKLAANGYTVIARHKGKPSGLVTLQPPGEMQSFYDAIDVLYLPYRSEGYSTVALEAMSQAIPVVSNRIPGITEVCGGSACYGHVDDVLTNWKMWSGWCAQRYQQVKGLNNLGELIKFTL
jgi:hypothetical protein